VHGPCARPAARCETRGFGQVAERDLHAHALGAPSRRGSRTRQRTCWRPRRGGAAARADNAGRAGSSSIGKLAVPCSSALGVASVRFSPGRGGVLARRARAERPPSIKCACHQSQLTPNRKKTRKKEWLVIAEPGHRHQGTIVRRGSDQSGMHPPNARRSPRIRTRARCSNIDPRRASTETAACEECPRPPVARTSWPDEGRKYTHIQRTDYFRQRQLGRVEDVQDGDRSDGGLDKLAQLLERKWCEPGENG